MRCTECGCGYSFLRILNAEPVPLAPRLTIGSRLAAPLLHGYCSSVHFVIYFFTFLFIFFLFAHFYCIHLCVQLLLFNLLFLCFGLGLQFQLFDSLQSRLARHCTQHCFMVYLTQILLFQYHSSPVSCKIFVVWPLHEETTALVSLNSCWLQWYSIITRSTWSLFGQNSLLLSELHGFQEDNVVRRK